MYCLVTRNDFQYWLRDDQVEQVQSVLNSGAKWLKLGNDYINTADVVGIVNEEVYRNRVQRKRGFQQVGYGEWVSRYDTQDNWKEPYIPTDDNWNNKKLDYKKIEEVLQQYNKIKPLDN